MAGQLNERKINSLPPGRHHDGQNLYLVVSPNLRRSWLLRFQMAGERQDMGLGAYPATGLKEARQKALEALRLIGQGQNPIEARKASKSRAGVLPTFAEIATQVIAEAQARSVNEKARYQWERHLGPAYCGLLLARPIDSIKTTDVADVLRPVWATKPEVARKLCPAIRRVFEYGRIVLRDKYGREMGPNPANWADLKALGFMPPQKLSRGRHPSLSYSEAPSFISELQKAATRSALGLQLLVLTNVRTDSLIKAKWAEFDLEKKIWSVPALNLKDKKHRSEPFRVPLSEQAIAILSELKKLSDSDFLLQNREGDAGCSNGIFLSLIKRMNWGALRWIDQDSGRPITPHGFRATFRTWAEEKTDFPRAVIEEAMGHQVGNNVERAYRRTDVLEKRRKLMQDWADYLSKRTEGVPCQLREIRC
jgi:integrase